MRHADLPDSIQQFQAAEGVRNGVLFEYAVGKVIITPDSKQLTIIGRELAAMHNVTANLTLENPRITYDTYTTLERPLKIIAARFADLKEEYDFLKKIAGETLKALNDLGQESFSYGYCHYDYMPKNFHFDENDHLTIFDFDWAGRGYLANDIMVMFFQYFFLQRLKAITRAEAESCLTTFLQGYQQLRPISSEEAKAIPHLGVMFLIYGLGFYEDNYDDFSNSFFHPRFIRDRIQLIREWSEEPLQVIL